MELCEEKDSQDHDDRMRDLVKYFIYGSWWVALCAATMGLITWFELTGTWWNTPLFIFIFGSTLVIYNMNMLSGLNELRDMGSDSERHHWCMANERKMNVTLIIGLLMVACSVWFLNRTIWLLMLPMSLVAAAYVMPIIRKNTDKIRIREIGLWKIFLIAVIWAGMTVILPAVHLYGFGQITEVLSWQLAIERSVFILAITIPFDVRDLINDAKKRVRTLSSVLGWKKSILLAEALLFLFGLLIYFRLGTGNPLLIGYLLNVLLTAIIVGFATPNRNDVYCSFWVEGTMLAQFISILIFI